MKLTVKNNAAVSPVIGTILLVAITVVLVAIIAAVVMGMAGSTGNSKDVGLTAEAAEFISRDTWFPVVQVIIYGGKDVDDLVHLNVSVEGAETIIYFDPGYTSREGFQFDPDAGITQEILSNPVGVPLNYAPYPLIDGSAIQYVNVLVTVTGTFTDGTKQILLTRTLTFPTEKPHGTKYPSEGMGSIYSYIEVLVEEEYFPASPKFR